MVKKFHHRIRIKWLAAILAIIFLVTCPTIRAEEGPGQVFVLTATGSINPGLAEFIVDGIQTAQKAQAEALVIELDTPGGLDTSMRQIAQGIINAQIPVVVYVYPKGARAASAGLIITLASHIAAMAPGTNIGAAHPVAIGAQKMDKEMSAKVVNDMAAYVRSLAAERARNAEWAEKAVRQSVSIPAAEAHKLKVVDVLADDLPDLLKKIDGRVVRLNQVSRTLKTAKAKVVPITEGLRHQVLKRLADPNVAMILMMIGLAGLYFELANPGAILPGVLEGHLLIAGILRFSDPAGEFYRHPIDSFSFYLFSFGNLCYQLWYAFRGRDHFPGVGRHDAVPERGNGGGGFLEHTGYHNPFSFGFFSGGHLSGGPGPTTQTLNR